MFDLKEEGIYIPNTKVMRNYSETVDCYLYPVGA